MSDAVVPFHAEVSAEQVRDLRHRLALTRWADTIDGSGWTYGVDLEWLQGLCGYWADGYDWSAFEQRLNGFPQYLTQVAGQRIHFHHIRSPEPDARPLILSHGWPGSVVEFHRVVGPLADPRAHGGDPADAFHVVAPSLPGFGFSGPTHETGYNARRIAAAFDTVMRRLGYDRYFAHGGDKGTLITILLAAGFPERVQAIHLNMIPPVAPDVADPMAGLSDADRADLHANAAFMATGVGYQFVHRTRPQTLAFALADSPAGLAAWIADKFDAWSDGGVDRNIGRDRLLDNISLYWLTGTIASSMRIYFEDHGPGRQQPIPPVSVPTGHAIFPAEIIKTPRAWAEQRFNIVSWSRMPQGGHFAAMEVPDLLVDELRGFFRRFR